jgi:hypothetical protein
MNPKHIRAWLLVLVCAVAGTAACGGDDDGGGDDDDGGASVRCGDDVLNGDEECDGTAFGANDCTTAGNFAGGELACTDVCTFDTSGCNAEAECNNGFIEEGEDCDGDALGDATCESAGAFTGGELACADDCSFDTSGCLGGGGSASEQIAAAREAADGTALSLPIGGAMVTYIRPAVGDDPAGIFIQAEQAGPALFVAVAASDLDEALAVGDTVSFTITAKVTQDGQPRATAVTGFGIDASGGDVEALVQDASAATALLATEANPDAEDYDSELIVLDATILADFSFAGGGHVAAAIATEGIPGGTKDAPRFRLEATLQDSLDLSGGCVVRIGPTPLWRFLDVAQPAIWAGGEVEITSCNAPQVVSAAAPTATSVVVSFDRLIDPATVQAGDFTFDPALDVTAVAVAGRQVTLTTETQVGATDYTLTVAAVSDTLGSAIDTAADTAGFTGFGGELPEQVFIWEVETDQDGTENGEFIEMWNNTGAAINFANQGWYLLLMNGNGDVAYRVVKLGPDAGTLAADGVWTVGTTAGAVDVDQDELPVGNLQNGTDGLLLIRCDDCTGVADFGANFDPGTGNTVTATSGATGTKVDAMVYGPDNEPDPELEAKCLGATRVIDDTATDSLQRTSAANWAFAPSTPGQE